MISITGANISSRSCLNRSSQSWRVISNIVSNNSNNTIRNDRFKYHHSIINTTVNECRQIGYNNYSTFSKGGGGGGDQSIKQSNNSNNYNQLVDSTNRTNTITFRKGPKVLLDDGVGKQDDDDELLDFDHQDARYLTSKEIELAHSLPNTSSPLSDPTHGAMVDIMGMNKRYPIMGKGKKHLYEFNTEEVAPQEYFKMMSLNHLNVIQYISKMGLCGHYDAVLNTLTYLDNLNIQITPRIYSVILRSMGLKGDVENAVKLFDRIVQEKIQPTVHMFDGMINAYLNAGDTDKPFQLLKAMENNYGLVPDHVNYTTMVHGLIKNKKIDMALEVFSDAKTKGMDPDSVTLSVVIDACAKNDRLERALNYFEEFKYLNIAPTEVTFNSLINACSMRSDNQSYLKAFQLFQEMSLYNFQPDIITYTSLLKLASKRGELSVIEKLYQDIMDRKDLFPMKPDERVFSLVIGGYANNQIDIKKTKYKLGLMKNLERIDRVLGDMKKLEVPMTKYPLDQYLKLYAYAGKLNDTEKIFKEKYPEYGIEPDVVTYSIMMSMFCKNRRFEKALQLLHTMRDKGIKPDYKTYIILLFGTTRVGYAKTCVKLAKEMVELGIPPQSIHMRKIIKRWMEYPEIVHQLSELTVKTESDPTYIDAHYFNPK